MASPHVCGAVALYLGQDSSLSPTAVASKLLENSVINTISNAGSGTSNRMLFYGLRRVYISGSVSAHLENIGDRVFSINQWIGTKGESRRLEGFRIYNLGGGISLEYMAHLEGYGDTRWTSGYVGTRGESRRLEGFAIRMKGVNASKYSVWYEAHLQGGYTSNTFLQKDGAFCGSRGQSRRVEAIRIYITHKI